MSMDEFPLLDVPELVSCLQECDFSAATLETITKPTSHSIIKLYQQIIDLFANINTETYSIQPNQDITETLDTSNTIPIAILNLTCHKFFKVIGISDFNMMDLCKPDFQRTRRLLSAVVNYARFREERIFDYKESIQQMSDLSDVLESKFDSFNLLRQQNNEIRSELGYLNNDLDSESRNIEDNEEFNAEKLDKVSNDLEVQLKNLTKQQESLSLEYESYKLTKNDLLTELEKCGFQLVELESKRDKLKKISDTDVVQLDENIKQLQETLSANKTKFQTLVNKKDNLETTLKTLERIISELYDLTNVISSDLKVSYGREISIINTKKTIIEKKTTLENLLKTSLSSQLKLAKEQLSRQEIIRSNLKKDMASKIQENEEKIRDLNDIYSNEIMKRLMETDKYITNDIIEKEVKSIEAEINSKRQQFNNELNELEEEYVLLINHVKDYMSTVLNNLD